MQRAEEERKREKRRVVEEEKEEEEEDEEERDLAQHAVVPAEKKLSAGICIEYSLTFLARLPLRRRIGRPRCADRSPLYHCAYLCTLIISNMVRALSSRTTVPHTLLLSPSLSPSVRLRLSRSLSVARV